MKSKTSELKGRALNHVLATIEGAKMLGLHGFVRDSYDNEVLFEPEVDWAQGGPIIEREGMSIGMVNEYWQAHLSEFHLFVEGPTPLIAAMRCFVASKLGDEVEIPEELK